MPSVNPALQPLRRKPLPSAAHLIDGIRGGDRVVLSRAITLLESTRPEHQTLALEVLDACASPNPSTLRVGITGVPGVGKSTFIEALGTRLTAQGRRLAVLTIDPTSTRSRGSILGDKTRMPRLAADDAAFIRPSPTAGSLGGVARTTRETITLCEAAGFDTIIVETVGVGQSEVAVHAMVDFFLLLVLAGAGDELQGIKRGIVEMADAIVVTKADGPNVRKAEHARGVYRHALALFPPSPSGWSPKVMTCSAQTGDGLEAVWEQIEAFGLLTRENGWFSEHRRRQARHWTLETIEQSLRSSFFEHPSVREALEPTLQAVESGAISSLRGARALLARFQEAAPPPSESST